MHFHFSRLLPALLTLSSLSFTVALVSGQLKSSMALAAIMRRQSRICTPVPEPATCARSCGAGYTECISFPNCYNPTVGQSCCSDGTYCPAGYYCTDALCCPNGTPLSECGATRTLSVIPPTVPESRTIQVAVSTISTTVVVPAATTTTVETTTTDVVQIVISTSTTPGSTQTTTAASTNTTSSMASSAATPTETVVVQTANAASHQGQAVLGLALGGMGLAALL